MPFFPKAPNFGRKKRFRKSITISYSFYSKFASAVVKIQNQNGAISKFMIKENARDQKMIFPPLGNVGILLRFLVQAIFEFSVFCYFSLLDT